MKVPITALFSSLLMLLFSILLTSLSRLVLLIFELFSTTTIVLLLSFLLVCSLFVEASFSLIVVVLRTQVAGLFIPFWLVWLTLLFGLYGVLSRTLLIPFYAPLLDIILARISTLVLLFVAC